MAGHNKWSKIKRKKGVNDAKRGKIFTKLGKVITVAAKQGGEDPAMNPALANAISKAKAENMPNDNINRCIKRAISDPNSSSYEAITYEGYGAGGSAVIVETLTDNKNRTAGDVRHLFDKFGGSLGTSNSVSFMFDRKGLIVIEKNDNISEDELFEWIIEAEADDMIASEDGYEIYTSPNKFNQVTKFLENKGLSFASADVELIPQSYVNLDEKKLSSFERMIEKMEDNDDIQNIFHNVENAE